METNNLIHKISWTLITFVLLVFCFIFIIQNVENYYEWTVITDIRSVKVDSLTFPAFTFCMTKNWADGTFETYELTDDMIVGCTYNNNNCNKDDLEKTTLWHSYTIHREKVNCYTFNSGRDYLGNQRKLYEMNKIGLVFEIRMNLTEDNYVAYNLDANIYKPTESKLIHYITPGKFTETTIKRVIDEKLPEPYNPCLKQDSIEKYDSVLVQNIIDNNETYRQVNCYDLCFQQHISSLAIKRNISEYEAFRNSTDFKHHKRCGGLCPLECDSTYYELSFLYYDFSEANIEYYENLLNHSLDPSTFISIQISFDELQYTHMSQTAKMTGTDLVSNIGGVLGVFIEMSFFSFYRFITFFF